MSVCLLCIVTCDLLWLCDKMLCGYSYNVYMYSNAWLDPLVSTGSTSGFKSHMAVNHAWLYTTSDFTPLMFKEQTLILHRLQLS